MVIGIQKRQWFLLFWVLSVPLLLNAVAIREDVGTNVIFQILRGTYSPYPYKSFDIIYNPFPEILVNLLLNTAPLGLLAWLMIFISNKAFFQKQPLIAKLLETLSTASLIAGVFALVTGFLMPLVWLPKFHDYLLGLPASPFMMDWSRWLVFPTTAIILCGAVFLSGNKKLSIPPKIA